MSHKLNELLLTYDKAKGQQQGFLKGFGLGGVSFGDLNANKKLLDKGNNGVFFKTLEKYKDDPRLGINFDKAADDFAKSLGNVDASAVQAAKDIYKLNGTTANMSKTFVSQTSVFTKFGTSLKNIGGQFVSTIVNGAVSMVASTVLMTAISGIQAYIESEERMAQKAQEITGKFKEQSTQITDYSKRIIELRTVLDDETSSTEEVKSATSELYSIQNDLISQYGAYHDGIDLVNGDLESQLKTLREINRENAQRTINEINDTKTNKVKGRNFLYGLGEGIIATTLSPGLGTGMYASKFGANYFGKNQGAKQALNNTLFESDFFGRDYGTEKYKSTTDQIKKMVNTYEGEITTANKQILQLARNFDKAFEVKGNRITFVGDIYEIEDAVTKLQLQLESLGVTDEDVFNQLSQAASGTREVIQQVGDSYLSLIEAEVQTNGQLAKYRRDLGDVYNDYIAAQTAGDTDKVAELAQQYKEIFNTIAESGIGDEYLSYFENLYPELDAIISQWKFEVEILPKIKAHHNLEDFISGSNADKLKSLYGNYIASGGAGGNANPQMKGYWKTLEEAMADSGFTEMGSYIDYLKSRPEYSDGMNIIKQRMGSQWKDEYIDEFSKLDLTAAVDIEPKPNGMEYAKEEIEKYLSPVEVEADVKVSASEAVDSMNDAKTAITSLNDLWQQTVQDNVKVGRDKKYTDEFGNIIKQTDTSNQAIGYADPAMLTSVRSAFDKFSQDLEKKGDKQGADTINQSLKNFEETLVEFPGDADKAQGAIDDLITSYIDQTDIIKNLTEANAEWSIAQLEAYGIENAEAVVMSRLSKRTKELAASYSKLRDMVQQYNSAMAAGDTEGQEEGISNITNQLNDMYGFIDHNGKNFQPFDEKYVSQNMDMINEAVNDTSGKFNELDRYASKKYVADLIIDTDDSDLQNAYGQLWQFLDTFDGESIDIGSSMDGTPIYATLEQIRQALNVSATEWQEILSSMTGGTITADVKYKEVKLALPTFSYADWKSQGGGEITPKNVGKYLRTSVQVPEMSYKYSGKGTKAHYGGAPGGGSGGSGGGGGGGGDSSKNKDKINEDTKQSFDWIEVKLKRLQEAVQRLDKTATNMYKSWTTRNTALKDEIAKVTEEITVQQHAAERYAKNAEKLTNKKVNVKPKASDYEDGKKDKQYKYDLKQYQKAEKEWKSGKYQKLIREGKIGKNDIEQIKNKYLVELINQYTEIYQKSVDASDAVQDLRKDLQDLNRTGFDNLIKEWDQIIELTENETNLVDKYIDRTETMGYWISDKFYKNQRYLTEKMLKDSEAQLKAAVDYYNNWKKQQEDNGGFNKDSEGARELQAEIQGLNEKTEEYRNELAKLDKQIQELSWEKFDWLQEKLDDITNEAQTLSELLTFQKTFDDYGYFNNRGVANLAMLGTVYENNARKLQDYMAQRDTLKKQLKADPLNKTLKNELDETNKNGRDIVKEMVSNLESISSAFKESIDQNLSKLKELMDEYKSTLSSAKDLYDFQKNIGTQTKQIENLRKQLTAYQGDDSEAARKRRQELTNQLNAAEQQLQETEWDRYINQTSEMLDNLYEDYEKNLNSRLDDILGLLPELVRKVNDNQHAMVADGLAEIKKIFGIEFDNLESYTTKDNKKLLSGVDGGKLAQDTSKIKEITDEMKKDIKEMIDPITNPDVFSKIFANSNKIVVNEDGSISVKPITQEDVNKESGEKSNASKTSTNTNTNTTAQKTAKQVMIEKEQAELDRIKAEMDKMANDRHTPDATTSPEYMELQRKEQDQHTKLQELGAELTDEQKSRIRMLEADLKDSQDRLDGINERLENNNNKENDLKRPSGGRGLEEELDAATIADKTEKESLEQKIKVIKEELAKLGVTGYATGSKHISSNQLAWTQERGSELIFRRSDGAMLTPLGSGDMVFTNSMSRRLWELAKELDSAKFSLLSASAQLPDINSNLNTTINQNNQIEITLPNVNDYASFKYELQNDIKFEKFIQEITLGQAMGNNTLNKRKY